MEIINVVIAFKTKDTSDNRYLKCITNICIVKLTGYPNEVEQLCNYEINTIIKKCNKNK